MARSRSFRELVLSPLVITSSIRVTQLAPILNSRKVTRENTQTILLRYLKIQPDINLKIILLGHQM